MAVTSTPLGLEQPVPGISGLSSFTHILDFVADRPKYEKRIKYLEQRTAECNEAVKRVVALNALGALQTQVKADLAAADKALADARRHADDIRCQADEHADTLEAELAVKQAAFQERTTAEDARLATWEAELEHRETATNAKVETTLKDLERAEELSASGLKMRDRYEAAVEKLRLITNEV